LIYSAVLKASKQAEKIKVCSSPLHMALLASQAVTGGQAERLMVCSSPLHMALLASQAVTKGQAERLTFKG
jgi:hypothetical protein